MLIVSAGHRDFATDWTAHGAGTALKRKNRFALRKRDRIDGQKLPKVEKTVPKVR